MLISVLATTLVLVAVLPPPPAESSGLEVAVAHADSDLAALPANAKGVRVDRGHITESRLSDFDVLVMDAPAFADALGESSSKNALGRFLRDHRALVVIGTGDDLAPLSVRMPAGQETLLAESGTPLPVSIGAVGVYRSPSGVWEYATFEYGSSGDSAALAGDAARWIDGLHVFEPRHGRAFTAAAADNANWQYWGSTTYSYTWSPHGRIGYTAYFHYALSDGSSLYDWWNVEMDQTTTPGYALWGNSWRTNMAWLTGDQNTYVSTNQLSDWGPGSLDASRILHKVVFEAGMRAGVDGASITSRKDYGYTLDDMVTTQASSATTEELYIRHDFGFGSGPAQGTWTNSPAWTVRTNEAQCLKVPWQNKAEWRDYSANSYYTTWINSWREICK